MKRFKRLTNSGRLVRVGDGRWVRLGPGRYALTGTGFTVTLEEDDRGQWFWYCRRNNGPVIDLARTLPEAKSYCRG